MPTQILSILTQVILFTLASSIGIYTILYPKAKKMHFFIYCILLGLGMVFSLSLSPLTMLPFFIALIGYVYYSQGKSLLSLISIPITYMIEVLCCNLFTATVQFIFHIKSDTIFTSIPLSLLIVLFMCGSLFTILYLGKRLLQRTLFNTTRFLTSGTITMVLTHTIIYSAIILIIVIISPALMFSVPAMVTMCVVTLFF